MKMSGLRFCQYCKCVGKFDCPFVDAIRSLKDAWISIFENIWDEPLKAGGKYLVFKKIMPSMN